MMFEAVIILLLLLLLATVYDIIDVHHTMYIEGYICDVSFDGLIIVLNRIEYEYTYFVINSQA